MKIKIKTFFFRFRKQEYLPISKIGYRIEIETISIIISENYVKIKKKIICNDVPDGKKIRAALYDEITSTC
jgi:hypothetical protein